MKTCATCNASHKNTVERVLRCMGCVARPNGNSNWRPMGITQRCGAGEAQLRPVPHDRRVRRQKRRQEMATSQVTITLRADAKQAIRAIRQARLAIYKFYGWRRFFMRGWWAALLGMPSNAEVNGAL